MVTPYDNLCKASRSDSELLTTMSSAPGKTGLRPPRPGIGQPQVKRYGHYHSIYCTCQDYAEPMNDNILNNYNKNQFKKFLDLSINRFSVRKNCILDKVTNNKFSLDLSGKGFLESVLRVQQGTEPPASSWFLNKMADTVKDKLMETINSSWSGTFITAGAITTAVTTLISIILSVVDMINNGTNSCRTMSLISNFTSLLGQIAVAVGVVDIFKQIPTLLDTMSDIFSAMKLDDHLGAMLQDDKIKPVQETHVLDKLIDIPFPTTKARTLFTMRYKDSCTTVEPCTANLREIEVPKDGKCGYHAIVKLINNPEVNIWTLREEMNWYCNDVYSHLKESLEPLDISTQQFDSKYWMTDEHLMLLSDMYGMSFCIHTGKQFCNQIVSKHPLHPLYHIKHENNHWTPLIEVKQQGMPSIETFITTILSLISIALTTCGMSTSWGANAVKSLIEARKIRTTMKAECKDAKEFVETISEDVFNLKLNSSSILKDSVIEVNNRLATYLSNSQSYYCSKPYEFVKMKACVKEAEQLYTSGNKFSKDLPDSLQKSYQLLYNDLLRAKHIVHNISKMSMAGRRRQEPVAIMIVGRHGAGKTHLINNYLVPELCKYLNVEEAAYALNFGQQEKYFTHYSGNMVAVYDEFLARGNDDPLIPHMNGIVSSGSYNMAGADLEIKHQECLIKVLLLASNKHYVSLTNKLTPEAEEAFYSRMIRFEVINKNIPPTSDYNRNAIARTPTYSELEIRHYTKNASKKSTDLALTPTPVGTNTLATQDPYTIISKEELLDMIQQQLEEKECIFKNVSYVPPEGKIAKQNTTNPIPELVNAWKDPLDSREYILKQNSLIHSAHKDVYAPAMFKVWTIEEWEQNIIELMDYINVLDEEFPIRKARAKATIEMIIYHDIDVALAVKYKIYKLMDIDLNKFDLSEKEQDILKQKIGKKQQATTDSKVDHLVVNINGMTDSGKSTSASDLGMELSILFHIPLVNITTQDLCSVIITTPSVVVLHDKMGDEEKYVQFYDSLPKPSIIINTNNLRFKYTRGFISLPSYQDIASNGRISQLLSTLASCCQREDYTIILPHSRNDVHPGFARRIGVPGQIKHANEFHYRSFDTTCYYDTERYAKFFRFKSKEVITIDDVLQEVTLKYIPLAQQADGVLIVKKNKVNVINADVTLRFNTVEELVKCVNDPAKMIAMFIHFQRGKNIDSAPELSVSHAVLSSPFTFSPTMFKLPVGKVDINTIKNMAISSYAILRKGNANYTCCISVGNEFVAVCKEGKIEYSIDSSYESLTYMHNIVTKNYNNTEHVSVEISEVKMDSTNIVASYPAESVVKALFFGITNMSPEDNVIPIYKYLKRNEKSILEHPSMLPLVLIYRPQKIIIEEKLHQVAPFFDLWEKFTNSTLFSVVKVLACISVTMISLLSILTITKTLYNYISKNKKEVVDTNTHKVIMDGIDCSIKTSTEGNKVNFDVTMNGAQPLGLEEYLTEFVASEYGDKYEIGKISKTIEQGKVYSENKHKKMSKSKGVATEKVRVISSVPQNAEISSTSIAVQEKIKDNQCWVYGTKSSCYGLRWKEDKVLTPAHIWTDLHNIGNINIPIDGVIRKVKCEVLWLDCDNDIAMAIIRDTSGRGGRSTIPKAKDLTSYFVDDHQLDNLYQASIMLRNCVSGDRPNKFFKASSTLQNGFVNIQQVSANKVNSSIRRELVYYRTQLENVNTTAGDCGSPYISLDTHQNHQIIIGFHTNLALAGSQSFGTVVTREYLSQITEKPRLIGEVEQQGTFSNTETITHRLLDEVHKNPNKLDLGVEYCVTDFYKNVFDNLYDLNEKDDIWYDAETNPTSHIELVGYDPNFKPSHIGKDSHMKTPFSHVITDILPDEAHLSVVDSRKHSNPSSLKKLNGRPSVLATELNKYSEAPNASILMQKLFRESKETLLGYYQTLYPDNLGPMNDLEIINGLYLNRRDSLYGTLEPIDLTTSAGDHVLRRFSIQTKKPLFRLINHQTVTNRDIYTWGVTPAAQAVHELYTTMDQCAQSKYRILTLMKDAPKRELVGKKDKTRLFTVCCLEDLLLTRKWLGRLQGSIMKHHTIGHTKIGIDPIPGFHTLYMHATRISQYGEAGDFKAWDKHLLSHVIVEVFDLWFDLIWNSLDDEQRKTITRMTLDNVKAVICDITINSLSTLDGHVYFKCSGNASGGPLTGPLNSTANDVYTISCLKWLINRHNILLSSNEHLNQSELDALLVNTYGSEFEKYISIMRKPIQFTLEWVRENFYWFTYGDDYGEAIKLKYTWLVNFATRKGFYQQIGLVYDSPAKDGSITKIQPLNTISFLSRTFRLENGLIFPALKKTSINSLLHWSRNNTKEQYEQNFKDCLDEAIMHGKDYYLQVLAAMSKIMRYCSSRGLYLNVVLTSYEEKLRWAISRIRNDGNISPMEPCQKVDIVLKTSSLDNCNETFNEAECKDQQPNEVELIGQQTQNKTNLIKISSSNLQQGQTMSSMDEICAEVDLALKEINFSDTKILTGYRPYPAFIQQEGNPDRVSIVFDAAIYDINKSKSVQSDLGLLVIPKLAAMDLTLARITVVSRKMTKNYLESAWQILFNVKQTRLGLSARFRSLNMIEKPRASKKQQAYNEHPVDMQDEEDRSRVTLQHNSIQKRMRTSPWHENLEEMAHKYMQTLDSPIAIPMDKPQNSVLFKRALRDLKNMPPAMGTWAKIHSYTTATRKIKLRFTSVATVTSDIVVGIATSNKTTYTIQELQVIESADLDPQKNTLEVELSYADLSRDGTMHNRYTFYNGTDGTDLEPIEDMTLVILLRVPAQNSFDNKDNNIFLTVEECFGKGDFVMTQEDIVRLMGSTPENPTIDSMVTLAHYLNSQEGVPVYICSDGGNIPESTYTAGPISIPKRYRGGFRFDFQSQTITTSGFYGNVIPRISLDDLARYQNQFVNKVHGIDTLEDFVRTYELPTAYRPEKIDVIIPLNGGARHIPFTMPQNLEFNDFQTDILDFYAKFLNITNNISYSEISTGLIGMKLLAQPFEFIGTGFYGETGEFQDVGRNPSYACLIQYGQGYTDLVLRYDLFQCIYENHNFGFTAILNAACVGTMYVDLENVNTDLETLSYVVREIQRNVSNTLDPDYSLLTFPASIPKTLTEELAETEVPVEFNDPDLLTLLDRKFDTLGYDKDKQVMTFSLSTTVLGSIVVNVIYDGRTRVAYIRNSPQSSADKYKVLQKLYREDLYISNIAAVDRRRTAFAATNTSKWVSRIAKDDSVFSGRRLIKEKYIVNDKKQALSYVAKPRKSPPSQAALAAAGVGVIGEVFNGISQYFLQKGMMDEQFKNAMKLLEKDAEIKMQQQMQALESQLEVQQQKYEYEIEMLKSQLAAQQEMQDKDLANKTAMQETNFKNQRQMQIDRTGLMSGLRNRTNNFTGNDGGSSSNGGVNEGPSTSLNSESTGDEGFEEPSETTPILGTKTRRTYSNVPPPSQFDKQPSGFEKPEDNPDKPWIGYDDAKLKRMLNNTEGRDKSIKFVSGNEEQTPGNYGTFLNVKNKNQDLNEPNSSLMSNQTPMGLVPGDFSGQDISTQNVPSTISTDGNSEVSTKIPSTGTMQGYDLIAPNKITKKNIKSALKVTNLPKQQHSVPLSKNSRKYINVINRQK